MDYSEELINPINLSNLSKDTLFALTKNMSYIEILNLCNIIFYVDIEKKQELQLVDLSTRDLFLKI
jgi:hypothetical protein